MSTKTRKHSSLCLSCSNYATCDKFVKSVLVPRSVTKYKIYNIQDNSPYNVSACIIKCKNYIKDKERVNYENCT